MVRHLAALLGLTAGVMVAVVFLHKQGKDAAPIMESQVSVALAKVRANQTDNAAVQLERSFLIPPEGEQSTSHTPAVAFTGDGKRLYAATSGNELVEFEAGSRGLLRRISFPEAGTDGVSIDGLTKFAVWALEAGGLAVMDLKTEEVVARDDDLDCRWVAASPDGKSVAVSSGKSVEIRSLPSLERIGEGVKGHEAEVTYLAWSPDGSLLASTAKDGRLLIHDVKSNRVVHSVVKNGPLYAVAFRPDGEAVAFGGQAKIVREVTLSTGREEVLSSDQPYYITCLGYSPDGSRLAVGDESCDVWLLEVASKKMVFHGKHHNECWLNSVTWGPDCETFVFGCRPNDHAGRPTEYWHNNMGEAWRIYGVQRKREALVEALDTALAKEKDGDRRKELDAYKQALATKEKNLALALPVDAVGSDPLSDATNPSFAYEGVQQLATMGGPYLSFKQQESFSSLTYGLNGDAYSLKVNSLGIPKDLPPELSKLAAEHEDELMKESKRLSASYALYLWKVKAR